MGTPDARTNQLASNLQHVKKRISAAAQMNSRVEPQLIVVTKFHPAEDVTRLHGLGVSDVGENRDQEAAQKSQDVGNLDLRWHFIGQLQKNKAKSVVRYAHSVQSIDRASLIQALSTAMVREQDQSGRGDLGCLLQIDLSAEAQTGQGETGNVGRGGALPANMLALAEQLSHSQGLRLDGLMAVAPLGVDPVPAFEKLALLSQQLRSEFPDAQTISAGMSHDLEAAIAVGATHLRVGSDVLGPRPAVG